MKIKLPIFFGLILIFLATVVAESFELYYRFRNLDTLLHFLGGFIAAWFVYAIYSSTVRIPSKVKVFTVLMVSVFVIGWLWELAEYLSTVYSPIYAPVVAHYFYLGNWEDILTDVFVGDIPGAVAFYLLYVFKLHKIKINDNIKI